MKNHTVIELTKKVEELNSRLANLKLELAANTQAKGHNTHATEKNSEMLGKLAMSLITLAKDTDNWRTEDKAHHKGENDLDKQKLEKIEALEKAVKDLVKAVGKAVEGLESKN